MISGSGFIVTWSDRGVVSGSCDPYTMESLIFLPRPWSPGVCCRFRKSQGRSGELLGAGRGGNTQGISGRVTQGLSCSQRGASSSGHSREQLMKGALDP